MSSQSPGSVLYSSDGYELAVVDGASYIAGTRALIISGINPIGDTVFTPTAEEGALGTAEMSNDFIVQSNVSVATGGSMLVTNNYFGTQEIALIVNAAGSPSGTGGLTYTIQEVDPGNGTTVFGNSASTTTITSSNAPGVFTAVLDSTTSPMVKVSWVPTGTFALADVYATVVTKNTPATQAISGTITATNLSISPVGTAPPADASYIGALANTSAPSMTNGDMYPLSLTTVGALRVDGSAVNQPVVGIGTPGSPAGGVLTVQGVSGSVAINVVVQGVTATASGYLPITGPVNQGNQGTIAESWYMEITDGTNGPAAVKGPSTGATSTDPALVVALSPNTPLPSGSNVIGSVSQNGTWTVQQGNAPWSVVGDGSAGAPTGGVLSIQGVSGGYSLNVNIESVYSGALSTVDQGNQGTIAESWYMEITDGVHGPAAVKASGVAATGTDDALVVALSPNTPLPAGTNVLGSVSQASAPWVVTAQGAPGSPSGGVFSIQGVSGGYALNVTVQGVTATASGYLPITGPVNQGNQGTIAESWYMEITDGTNGPAAVKGPNTGALASDPALVVALSPNSPLPSGSNLIGSVGQASAPWLFAGQGSPGTPSGGVVSIQGVPSGSAVNVNIESIATGVLLVTTNKASTSSVTSVAGSTSTTTVLAANSNRIAAAIYNNTNKNMYVLMGSGASTSTFSILLLTGSYWEVTDDYTGIITAVWASGVNGSALITELRP